MSYFEMTEDSQGCGSKFQLVQRGGVLEIKNRHPRSSWLCTALRPWADDNFSESLCPPL